MNEMAKIFPPCATKMFPPKPLRKRGDYEEKNSGEVVVCTATLNLTVEESVCVNMNAYVGSRKN